MHAVGDRAIETYVAALEATGRPEIWTRKRPRLEHGDMLMPDLIPRAKALGMVVPFGNLLHVSGTDAGALERAIAPYRDDATLRWHLSETGLEDVFIHLTGKALRD